MKRIFNLTIFHDLLSFISKKMKNRLACYFWSPQNRLLNTTTITLITFLSLNLANATESLDKVAAKNPGSGPNPYSECGIGAALFPTIPGLAVSSNVIWDFGSTAITSALSSPQTCNAKKVKTAKLILETLPEIEKDLALGSGTYLSALGDIMECDTTGKTALNAKVKSDYTKTILSDDYQNKSNLARSSDMYNIIRSTNNTGCKVIL